MDGTTLVVILGTAGDALVVAEAIRRAAAAGEPIALAGFLDDNRAGQRINRPGILCPRNRSFRHAQAMVQRFS